jgi:hypothetical protein
MSPAAWTQLNRPLFYLALAVNTLLLVGLGILITTALSRTRARAARTAASEAARKAIYDAIVAYLAGSPETRLIRQYLARQREDVADTLLMFQTAVAGSARDQLCNLALDVGLVHDWCMGVTSRDVICRRACFARLAFVSSYEPVRRVAAEHLLRGLDDPDEECRLAAARGVLYAGQTGEVTRVFELAVRSALLTRVVLCDDLRRHALMLGGGPLPAALRSEDAQKVQGALEILVAWERAIALDNVREFFGHRERTVRVLAFRLAPRLPVTVDAKLAINGAINGPDREIRALAITAAGHLKLVDATAELAACLRTANDIDLARLAAQALAAMSARGIQTLTEFRGSGNPVTALAAGEALARGQREA